MLKKMLLAGAATTLLIGTAQAADIEAPPAMYDWTGGYVGIQAGWAWDSQQADAEVDPPGATTFDVDDIDVDGFVGGAHLGYLWQSDSLVFGLEGDIEYADIDGSEKGVASNGAVTADVTDIESSIDWLGSLRLRLGFAMDRALLYATGGVAVGGVELEGETEPAFVGALLDDDDSSTNWGWTVGGGIDYAFDDDISLRLEYRYTDLGSADISQFAPGIAADLNTDVDVTFHAVRAGLSWHFH